VRSEEGESPKYRIEENIPLCLKPYTRILNYHSWGEVLYIDYNHMKAELLDTYVKSGDITQLQMSFNQINELQKQYPNTYMKDYVPRIVDFHVKEPLEISEEKYERAQYIISLFKSDEGRSVLQAIQEFNDRFPEPPTNGQITPDYELQRERWNDDVSRWYNAIQNRDLQARIICRPNFCIHTHLPELHIPVL
jgi:hypothetical protein